MLIEKKTLVPYLEAMKKLFLGGLFEGVSGGDTPKPVADPENFGGGDLKHKTSKIRMSSPKLRVIFWPKSEFQTFFSPKFRWFPKKKKKKKKKKVFTKIETDFSPDSLRLGRWGGMHPEMEPNYSKRRLIFRPKSLLLGWWGGCIHPIPPLNPPLPKTMSKYSSLKYLLILRNSGTVN